MPRNPILAGGHVLSLSRVLFSAHGPSSAIHSHKERHQRARDVPKEKTWWSCEKQKKDKNPERDKHSSRGTTTTTDRRIYNFILSAPVIVITINYVLKFQNKSSALSSTNTSTATTSSSSALLHHQSQQQRQGRGGTRAEI